MRLKKCIKKKTVFLPVYGCCLQAVDTVKKGEKRCLPH